MNNASRWPARPLYGRRAVRGRAPWSRWAAALDPAIRHRLAACVLVGLNLMAAGVIAADLAGLDAPDSMPVLPVWLAVAAFTLAGLAVVRLEIDKRPVVLALRATPLLAGLTYLVPTEVVAAHVIGTTIASLVRNRPSPSVAAITVAWNALGTALAAVVFTALLPAWTGTAAGWWLAGSTAMVVATAAWTVGAVARWSPPDGARPPRAFRTALAYGSIAAVVDTSLAVTVVIFMRSDASELLLLVGPAALSLATYRAWTGMRRRQARVEYLYACARLLEGPSSGAAMFDELLGLTRDIVGADRAELLLDDTADRRLGAGVGPGASRRLLAVVAGDPLLGTLALVGPGSRAVVVRRRSRTPGGERAVGLVDAVVVRIDGGAGATGILSVAGRRDGSPFARDDVRLLESVVVNLGAALGSRRMTEELRASLGDLAQLTALTTATGDPGEAVGVDGAVRRPRAWTVAAESSIAIGVVDADFTWQWVNDALCRLLGAQADDLVGRRFEVPVLRDDIEPAHGLVSRMLRGESRGSAVEIRLRRPDASEPVVVSLFVRPPHGGGSATRVLCMLEDLTAVRAAEELAERVEWRAQAAILELTAIREPDAVLRALVAAARDVTGADVVTVEGGYADQASGLVSLRVPIPGAGDLSLLLGRNAEDRPFTAEDAAVTRRLTDQAGVSLDNAYAHQRALELVRELDEANAALQQASAARSRFLANVSHELRTPLHAILIAAQLLADPSVATRDPARARALPGTIDRTGRHLLSLIEDLVDLARIELKDLRIDLVPTNLGSVLDDAAGQVEPLAHERGIELSVASGNGILLRSDPLRLRQVLVNLLANAVKYTHRGGLVRLNVERDHDGLRLIVLDTGIGIDPSDLERAFAPFERLAATGSPGAGLGLPIARRIMELHGGSLTATSLPGLGSVFTAHLPVHAILEHQAAGPSTDATPPVRQPTAPGRAIA